MRKSLSNLLGKRSALQPWPQSGTLATEHQQQHLARVGPGPGAERFSPACGLREHTAV